MTFGDNETDLVIIEQALDEERERAEKAEAERDAAIAESGFDQRNAAASQREAQRLLAENASLRERLAVAEEKALSPKPEKTTPGNLDYRKGTCDLCGEKGFVARCSKHPADTARWCEKCLIEVYR